MTRLDSWRVLPHEWAFGLFWFSVARSGSPGVFELAAGCHAVHHPMLVINVGLILACRSWKGGDGSSSRELRLFSCWPSISPMAPAGRRCPPSRPVAGMASCSGSMKLLPGQPSSPSGCRGMHPVVTELLSFCYLTFFFALLF